MTALTEVYEGTTTYLTVAFFDGDGNSAVPTTVTWACHDVLSGEEIQAATSVTPAPSIEVTIPPSVNTMIDQNRLQEKHRITIVATYGEDDQTTSRYDFLVTNLQQVV